MRNLFLICVYMVCSDLAIAAPSDAMIYGKEQGQIFSYEFDIEASTPNGITKYKGVTNYTVELLTDDQLRLTYRGGLQEFNKPKGNVSAFPSIPRPMIPAPFGFSSGSSDFRGRMQTTNRIVMNRQGHMLSMEGDSQLPFLMGNLSLLPFEPLSLEAAKQWTRDFGVTINSTNQAPLRHFGFYGPFGPFSDRGTQEIQAASESAEYAIESENEQSVVVKKSYRLKTSATAEGEAIEITGEGNWTYHVAEKIPDSLDFKMKVSQQEDNVTITVPVSIKFQRLPPEVIAKRAEEVRQKALAAKEYADRPLTNEERTQILKALESGTQIETKEALGKLAAKNPQSPDLEIAAAVEKATKSSSSLIIQFAEKALPNWSPEFHRKYEINKLYKGPLHLPSTGREVEAKTPLYVGQIVQMQEHGTVWQAAVIQRLLLDDRVEVGFLMGGKPFRTVTLSRRNIQLAPEEVAQPARPKDWNSESTKGSEPAKVAEKSEVNSADYRDWMDSTGKHKIKARFLRLVDDAVYLQTEDNGERKIPLTRLSEKDQAFAKQAEENKDNPFMQ